MTKNKALAGRVALVTGANRPGIGRAIAQRLVAEGARVVVHASGRGESDSLDETRTLVAQMGGEVACIEADLLDDDARAQLLGRAAEFFGPIEILINNAGGMGAWAPPSKIDLAGRLNTFELNFQAPIDLALLAIPGMRERGWGRIVNISSSASQEPDIPQTGPPKLRHRTTAYGAAKLALERYSMGLADTLMGSGVTINCTKPFAIAWTRGADDLTRAMYDQHPHLIEGLEVLAEAVFQLVSRGANGLTLNSREVLQRFETPLHALDGVSLIGDAGTLVPREEIFGSAGA